MSPEQQALLMLKGIISEASPEEQNKVHAAAGKLREVITAYGDEGKVAMSLVVAEQMVEP